MNQPSREQIEARITALLLGELPADEAELLRFTISQDAALKQLHDELAATIVLVREAEKTPAEVSAEKTEQLKLSAARREKLLAHLKTPRKQDPLFWLKRIEVSHLVPVLVCLAIVALLAALLLPSLAAAKKKGMKFAAASADGPASAEQAVTVEQAIPLSAPVVAVDEAPVATMPLPAAAPAVESPKPAPEVANIVLPSTGALAAPPTAGPVGGGVYSQNVVGYGDTVSSEAVSSSPVGSAQTGAQQWKISGQAEGGTAPTTSGNPTVAFSTVANSAAATLGLPGESQVDRVNRSGGGGGAGEPMPNLALATDGVSSKNAPQFFDAAQRAKLPEVVLNANNEGNISQKLGDEAPTQPPVIALNDISDFQQDREFLKTPAKPAAPARRELESGKKSENEATVRFYRQHAAGDEDHVWLEKKSSATKVTKLPGKRANEAETEVAGTLAVAAPAAKLADKSASDALELNSENNFSVAPTVSGTGSVPADYFGVPPESAGDKNPQSGSDSKFVSSYAYAAPGANALAEKSKESLFAGATKDDVAGLRYLATNNLSNFESARESEKRLEEDKPLPKATPNSPIPQPEVLCRENNFSTFSLNVSDVSFKLAAASLERGQLPEAASIRSEEFINAFDYRDPEATAGQPLAFASERARYPFAHNRDLLRFSVKTAAAGRAAGRPLNLVLLLDNSGSMERADRVAVIREALRVLASQLQPQDTVSVVTFARTARLWADGVSGDTASAIFDRVGGITPEGGTNLEEAMRLAYETARKHYSANGMNRVVLLTDGAANLGNVSADALKEKVEAQRKQGIALDCFGIGFEDYNDDLLEQLSSHGDGRYAFLNSPEDASKEFAAKLAGALQIAAQDVKVQVEFNPQRVTSWRQIGYAKHQLTKEQFRDNTVDAAEIAAQEAGNALYAVETKADGIGPVATVRVRYKVPGTTEYRERSWNVEYEGVAPALENSSPAMRLAATASAFSEWLAASPFAQEVTLDQLQKTLSGVPQIYGADVRPKQLETMLREAKSVAGK